MAAQLSPSHDLTALTPKELEILRLLAAGHTVKSIAVQLGRSEASINERLRDARRKTGVGSSRELARLLDAQNYWDRNIDLAPGQGADQSFGHRPYAWRRLPKGLILLLVALPIAAAGLFMMATRPIEPVASAPRAATAALNQSPLVGTWALEVERIPAEERPGRATITFRALPKGKWETRVEVVGADGNTRTADSIAAADGVPVPISGNMDIIDTLSLRQPAPNTLVVTLGKGGSPVSTRVYTVSKDRKSMTETIVWAGQDLPKLETTHFRRVD